MNVNRPSTKLGVSIRIYDSPGVKELVASRLRSYANSTTRERSVYIAILGVDRAILRRQEKRRGATGGRRGRYSSPRCRHSSPRCRYSNPWCRHSNPRCRHSKPEEAREKGRGDRGREKGEVSRVRCLEAGWIARESRGTKSHKGREEPSYKPILGVRSERGLGFRGTVRRSVRGRWVVSCFYQVTRNHQRSGTRLEAQIVSGADRKRAR